jgi:hypothetical protein
MSDDHPWIPLLREALAMLALPPSEQARLNGPGCLSCDLMEDFKHARQVALSDASALSADQRALLDRIDSAFDAMEPADYTCGDNSVVERSAWVAIRILATDALREFAWEKTVVAPFKEVKPGVWHRPPLEA